MRIIYVTGCLGFMASYFTKMALDSGWMVCGIDKLTYAANEEALAFFKTRKNFKFIQEDIVDLDHLCECDYIVNFAAESHVDNSIECSRSFMHSNVMGVRNLLELVRAKSAASRPIFFHISTDEVYGDIQEGAHTEKDLLKPSNPYAASKAAADMLILAWARTFGINYIILRPTNNYGIRQYPEKLIPVTIKNLQRGRKTPLHNEGEPVRNWLHAEDTARAVMTIIAQGKVNEIYNVAGGFEQKNIVTVRKILDAYFGEEKYRIEDWVDFSCTRPGQDVRYALNDNKLRELGWEPKKEFDEELQHIVKIHRNTFTW